MNLATKKLLAAWSQLEQAFRGESSYGGDVCEIYAYHFYTYLPGVHSRGAPEPKPGSFFWDDYLGVIEEAGAEFKAMLAHFGALHEVTAEIETEDGWIPASDWDGRFVHREHVRFVK